MKEKESENRQELQPVEEPLLEEVTGGAALPDEEEEGGENGWGILS